MDPMKTLLDSAAKVCGSDAALARKLGIKREDVYQMRHGRTITPETAAELADIAGEDAREAAIAAIMERARGTRREVRLREVLGKALVAGVAGMSVFSYNADSILGTFHTQTKTSITTSVNPLYIVSSRNCRRRHQKRRSLRLRHMAASGHQDRISRRRPIVWQVEGRNARWTAGYEPGPLAAVA
jgi:DNA-binding transcriptional regulator YdaS (Cro superfamily)